MLISFLTHLLEGMLDMLGSPWLSCFHLIYFSPESSSHLHL